MSHVLVMLLGVLAGSLCVYLVLESKRRAIKEEGRALEARIKEEGRALEAREQRIESAIPEIENRERQLAKFDKQIISYRELQHENQVLKHDLQNVDVNLRKLQLDHEIQHEDQATLDARCEALGRRFLKDNIKWVSDSLTANNFSNNKKRLLKVVDWVCGIGVSLSDEERSTLLMNLKGEYERAVRAAFEREEQSRIRAQIREEQKLEKEIERELRQLEHEREAIQAAIQKAIAESKDGHSAEIQKLQARLAEAEGKSERAISRAQTTKSGHVYVISNIGSFGEGVYKIGMTRRLEPQDRVRELSAASVPFPFDVHMMISSDDAPALENLLHRTLHNARVNKANPRKEFFRTEFESIRAAVTENLGEIEYVSEPEALQYHQSLAMSDEDMEFVESVFEQAESDGEHHSVED